MGILTRVVLIVIALVVVLALAGLAVWDIPPPSAKIEKVLPDDRFPR